MAPPWLVHLTDRLLTREPKRRIRLAQTGVALLITMPSLGVMAYAAHAGLAAWAAVLAWAAVALGGGAIVFGLIRSGWTERFADPALTLAQMLFAITCCAAAYVIAGLLRGAVFPLVMVVLVFGMFSLTPRQVLGVSLYGVAAFGAVMLAMAQREPAVFDPTVEWGHFLMLAAMMPSTSVLAGQLGRLRTRLQRQKRELADALSQIQMLAARDHLTGLINRRQMSELLERERHRSLRNGSRFSIALIDLDHFKRINDAHGHGAGDDVLRAFATEGNRRVRATDALGRWGGEEFMLLMPDTTLNNAAEGAQRLRRALESLTVSSGHVSLAITLSAGVVQHAADETIAHLIERADVALYRAKSLGRNRVVAMPATEAAVSSAPPSVR